jgi:ubiquinone/menaquinone biosynthesis C-methylase UbiE
MVLKPWELFCNIRFLKAKKMYSIEPLLQKLRIRQALPYIKKDDVLLDIGCDDPSMLLLQVKDLIAKGYGIDIVVQPKKMGKIEILRQDLQEKIEFKSKSADVITMLAVLEHMKYPEKMVRECYRILKPGGKLVITVPSPRNKPLLELLAKVGMVRREMIEQHVNYFSKKSLELLLTTAGFKHVRVKLFELGFNTFAVGQK